MKVPLVLIPGLLCDALLWQSQIAGLGGAADCWVAPTTADETMANAAARVLRESPFPRFALAGLSMGGYISLEIMRREPHRVTRLALLDTSARPEAIEQTRGRLEAMEEAEQGHLTAVSESLFARWVHPSRADDARLMAIVRSMARNVGKSAFIRQEKSIMSRLDSRPHLAAIACPTLVLCGREDASTPVAVSEEMAAAIPGARLAVIEHCGHLSTLEQPEAVTAILAQWLAGPHPVASKGAQ